MGSILLSLLGKECKEENCEIAYSLMLNLLYNLDNIWKIKNGVFVLWWIIGLFGVMIFSVPLSAIITAHMRQSKQLQIQMLQEQYKLEKLKHENFLLETEQLKLELQKMQLEAPKEEIYKIN